ncbi:MAG: PHP domain-containing protein [Oscillospiraceae bacterium]
MDKTNCRFDLHIHSTASDGTDSPSILLENIKKAGIGVFSLTDHDTISGALEIQKIVPDNIVFIKGIEFSCKTAAGKCHILGYNYDENAPEFKKIIEEGREKRRRKLDSRIEFLKDNFSIVLSQDELSELYNMNSVGKPHLGNLLVSKGYAENRNEAIEKYINPCKTESDRLDGKTVVEAILASGGTPVWAHPLGGTGEKLLNDEQFADQLAILKMAGIKGLECFYSRYTEDQIRYLLDAAEKNELFTSGGSDYHGTNKTVHLGELNSFGKVITSEMISLPIIT